MAHRSRSLTSPAGVRFVDDDGEGLAVVRDSNVRTSCDWLRNERREPSRDGIGVQGGVLILCLRTYAATAYIDVPKIAAGMTLPACIGADINRISSRAAN